MLISILLWLVFGAVVGWLAGKIMKVSMSLVVTIILGIVGALVGGFVASLIGLGSLAAGFTFSFWNIIISIVGACLVVWIGSMVMKK